MITRTLLLAASLFLPAPARAADWVIPQTTNYLTLEQQAFAAFPPPPAPGSQEDRKDLKAVFDWQHRRTGEQCARAGSAAHADFENFFGDLSPFPEPLPPEAAEFFARVKAESDGAAAKLKERFGRKRPFLRDPAIEPCLGRAGGLAYPSDHTTISRVFAHILAELAPGRSAEFFARADAAALDRVIGGVHHPADIEAGKRLADLLYAGYRKSPAFNAELKAVRGLLVKEKTKPRPARAGGK